MYKATRHIPTNIYRLELQEREQQESTNYNSNYMQLIATEVLLTINLLYKEVSLVLKDKEEEKGYTRV